MLILKTKMKMLAHQPIKEFFLLWQYFQRASLHHLLPANSEIMKKKPRLWVQEFFFLLSSSQITLLVVQGIIEEELLVVAFSSMVEASLIFVVERL